MSPLEEGTAVWIQCSVNVWRPGIVARPISGQHAMASDAVCVEVTNSAGELEQIHVPLHSRKGKQNVHLRNAVSDEISDNDCSADLSKLPMLHEPGVLHALQKRFEQGLVYTLSGPVLLAVNPFRHVPDLYSHTQLVAFADRLAEQLPSVPHVFAVAREAYQGIWHRGLPQTVLVSGESGAGKTETTKFIMRFLALVGTNGEDACMSPIERQVLESIPILEALGNATTLRNDNSSRFGKYIELRFGLDHPAKAELPQEEGLSLALRPRLVGAQTHTYLLEKVRVTCQQDGERSFHIFYQMLAAVITNTGLPCSSKVTYIAGSPVRGLAGLSLNDFAHLKQLNVANRKDEARDFEVSLASLRSFGIDGDLLSNLLDVIVAVLHVGNLRFVPPPNNSEGSTLLREDKSGMSIEHACQLLQVDLETLGNALCRKTMRAPGRDGVINMAVTVAKAVEARDALARHLYETIFTFVVARINAVVGSAQQATDAAASDLPFIGVLDIFGFEFFDTNSLEQLFINFTNELLQHYFNEVIFEHESKLYTQEGIQWDPLDFPDNAANVDLIGKAPTGILSMLDEECMTVGGSSSVLCSKLEKTHAAVRQFSLVKQRRGNFIIQHFAGPVEYTCAAFLEKNKDQLNADLVKCLGGSGNDLVRRRFMDSERASAAQEPPMDGQTRRKSRARPYSLSSEFREQLRGLMERIRATEPHFIRCIKPNIHNAAYEFDRHSVVQQLQYQGVLQAIEASRAGFPVRLTHRQSILQFRCLVPPESQTQLQTCMARGKHSSAVRLLFSCLKEPIGLESNMWALGTTLVFLKKDGSKVLGAAVVSRRRFSAIKLQSAWRCCIRRKAFLAARSGAIRIQACLRGLTDRKLVFSMRREQAALLLQSRQRARMAQALRKKRLHGLVALQTWFRARHLRRQLLQTVAFVVSLQAWWRRVRKRLHAKRFWRAAVRLQSLWRGRRSRRQTVDTKLAKLRQRQAVRSLVQLWRKRVCGRVLSAQETAAPIVLAACDERGGELASPATQLDEGNSLYVKGCRHGELAAAVAAMHLRVKALQVEAEAVRRQQEDLRAKAVIIQRWTLGGMLRVAASALLRGDCVGTRCVSTKHNLGDLQRQ